MYIYNADVYCDLCGDNIMEDLDDDCVEDTGDSNDYPQYFGEDFENDSPTHCGMDESCLDAEIIIEPNFYIRKVGSQIDTILTSYGVDYIKEVINEKPKSGCAVLWKSTYSDYL